MDKQKRKAFV